MSDFQYKLDPGSKKYECPSCGKKKFVRFIDMETGQYLPIEYGRCDREDNCGYFKIPKNVSKGRVADNLGVQGSFKKTQSYVHEKSYIPQEILDQTCIDWQGSTFAKNLMEGIPYPFHRDFIGHVVSLYRLGSIKHGYRSGAVTFPYIDENNNIHAIQVKQFNSFNHTVATDAIHSIIDKYHCRKRTPKPDWLNNYLQNEKKFTCLFGEHLLKEYPNNPIALVEAPKTALIGTLYFGLPDNPTNFLWLAVYNKSSLNAKKCWPIRKRRVVLFPDLAAYDDWKTKADQIMSNFPAFNIKTSDFLETRATEDEKKNGLDLADYLTKHDWREFRNEMPTENTRVKSAESVGENIFIFSHKAMLEKTTKLIGRQNHLHKTEILESISLAEFEYAIEHEIIVPAIPYPNIYYLKGSSPF